MTEYIGYFIIAFFGIYYFVFIICLIYFSIKEEWFCKNQLPEWKENLIQYYLHWKKRGKYQSIDNYVPEIDLTIENLDDII